MATRHEFSFTGSSKDYFGIWIVNLFLSVLTIGIYTAWAKVRYLRYFYGNTHLDGHSFDYHARPVQILIGRIIVVVAIGVLQLVNFVAPAVLWLGPVILLAYLTALPWIINKAIAFNARMTSYRNVRFNFRGSYWKAFGIFLLMPVAVGLTAGLLLPFMSRMRVRYIANNLRYGTEPFRFQAPIGPFYGNLGSSVLFYIVAGVGLAVVGLVLGTVANVTGLIGALNPDLARVSAGQAMNLSLAMSAVSAFYLTSVLVVFFYTSGVRNIAYNHTALGEEVQLLSSLSRWRYTWIIASNFLATIATIGMARPWAMIRHWRYLAANTALDGPESLAQFVDVRADAGPAAAAEYLDIGGIDFGL
ncbi:YjgN family protein [Tepidamorphus sp. 3E244]|uniref:YjgN family protein n=1 Tax=Tepidamorphus sp. 3E244 TaxID=3385498 RepID=UPI0038FCBE64